MTLTGILGLILFLLKRALGKQASLESQLRQKELEKKDALLKKDQDALTDSIDKKSKPITAVKPLSDKEIEKYWDDEEK